MPRSTTPDYYELLGVPHDADTEAITRAYRKLARVSHPDSGGNSGMFRLLRTAYETLTDPLQRKAYDDRLGSTESEPAPAEDAAPSEETAESDEPVAGTWQFADGTARSMVVEPEQLTWWSRVDPEVPAVVDPPYRQGRRAVAAAVLVFLAVTVTMAVTHLVALVSVAAGAVLIVAAYLRAYRERDNSTVAAVVGLVAVVGTGGYMYLGVKPLAPVLGFGCLAALVAAVVLSYRYGQSALLDRLAPPEAVAQVEYGQPGLSHASDDERFGERMGADALVSLTFLPGVRLFHGLGSPADGTAVDHAIACGRRVALVESRYWEPGRFSWTPHGALLRDGRHFPAGETGLHVSVAGYQRVLGADVTVRGFIMVIASRPGPVTVDDGPTDVTLGDPQTIVEELGDWFLQTGPVNVVDRRLLLRLHNQRNAVADGGVP